MGPNRIQSQLTPWDCINPNYVPCIAKDTMIATDHDEVHAQYLLSGDRVFGTDGEFDLVEDVLCLPSHKAFSAAVVRYPAQCAGNYIELKVSPGCKVYGLIEDPSARSKSLLKRVIVHSQELVSQDHGQFSFFCVVLREKRTMMANGSMVSTLNRADLTNLRNGQIENLLYG